MGLHLLWRGRFRPGGVRALQAGAIVCVAPAEIFAAARRVGQRAAAAGAWLSAAARRPYASHTDPVRAINRSRHIGHEGVEGYLIAE